jgi:hypothetical protein
MQNDLSKYLIAIGFITIMNGYVATRFMKASKETYHAHYEFLAGQNKELSERLSEFYQHGIKVDVTMYQPMHYQTDSDPDVTADGTRIRIHHASRYKFVALSRNLLKRWGGPFDYGDFVLLKGTDGKDGVYQVRDTMNSKWVNVVDILESINVKPYKFTGVDIFKLNWTEENA